LCDKPGDDLDTLLSKARARSPKLRALTYLKSRAQLQSSLAWSAYVPYVDELGLQWYNEPLDKRDEWRAFVQFAFPVFEPFIGKSREASIEVSRLDALYTDASRQIEADVRSDYDRLTGSLALVQLYEVSKQSIQEGLADVEKALEMGQADALRVAEVQARAVADQRNALHARTRCEAAAIDLARLTGDVALQ
jgi:outer membrane protein TolC